MIKQALIYAGICMLSFYFCCITQGDEKIQPLRCKLRRSIFLDRHELNGNTRTIYYLQIEQWIHTNLYLQIRQNVWVPRQSPTLLLQISTQKKGLMRPGDQHINLTLIRKIPRIATNKITNSFQTASKKHPAMKARCAEFS